VRRADNLATFKCRLSYNLGASNSWNPQDLSRSVMGLLYLSPIPEEYVLFWYDYIECIFLVVLFGDLISLRQLKQYASWQLLFSLALACVIRNIQANRINYLWFWSVIKKWIYSLRTVSQNLWPKIFITVFSYIKQDSNQQRQDLWAIYVIRNMRTLKSHTSYFRHFWIHMSIVTVSYCRTQTRPYQKNLL
jgi:hypothetical protein